MKSREAGIQQRLLSPDQAATYLGLGSRWAIRRLIVKGELQAVRIAGKLRLDHEDLDRFIADRKSARTADAVREAQSPGLRGRSRVVTRAPDALAPLSGRGARTGDTTVTAGS